MRKNGGGAIVNQASVTSSMTGVPDNGLYAATKGGIIGLTKSAALQVAAENISINAIASCAFDIPDDMFLRWIDDHHVSRKEACGWLPIKRLGKAEEIAAATLYLASDEARFGRHGLDHRRRVHGTIDDSGRDARVRLGARPSRIGPDAPGRREEGPEDNGRA
jgi:NAD(P)-dependent dehydrogenase (short-subunit alcohol dehydrogenase family)